MVTDQAGAAHHQAVVVVAVAGFGDVGFATVGDWKEGSGANHCPSGMFAANAAWLLLAALAHNLIRWVAHLGLGIDGPVVAKTIRRHLITLPGRITHRSRRRLHLPTDWPWKHQFLTAATQLRALPRLC